MLMALYDSYASIHMFRTTFREQLLSFDVKSNK